MNFKRGKDSSPALGTVLPVALKNSFLGSPSHLHQLQDKQNICRSHSLLMNQPVDPLGRNVESRAEIFDIFIYFHLSSGIHPDQELIKLRIPGFAEPLGEDRAREVINGRFGVHDTRFVVNYFRMSDDHRLLFGGGENYRPDFPKDIAKFVRPYMLKLFPQLKDVGVDYAWGGTLSVTVNRLPHLGRLEPNVFFGQGYSGHGIITANFAGKVIAEAIAGVAGRFDVFASLPIHPFPGGTLLRYPGMVLGMLYYTLRDRI